MNMNAEIAGYVIKYPRLFFWDGIIKQFVSTLDTPTAKECCELLSTYCDNSKSLDLTVTISDLAKLLQKNVTVSKALSLVQKEKLEPSLFKTLIERCTQSNDVSKLLSQGLYVAATCDVQVQKANEDSEIDQGKVTQYIESLPDLAGMQ